jgi:hypothetical protein
MHTYLHTYIHTYIHIHIHTFIETRDHSDRDEVAAAGRSQESEVQVQSETAEKQRTTALRALVLHVTLREGNEQLRHLTLRLGFSLLRTAALHAGLDQEMERHKSVAEKRMLQEKQR